MKRIIDNYSIVIRGFAFIKIDIHEKHMHLLNSINACDTEVKILGHKIIIWLEIYLLAQRFKQE